MLKKIILFLIINFAGLGLGSFFTNPGVNSDWYQSLNQAPWTPPGWVFGAAWTTIMICFAIFMAKLWGSTEDNRTVRNLFIAQWILNLIWNPIFFHFRLPLVGLIVIASLTILIGILFFKYRKELGWYSALILPYLVWLCIATSLNGYILFYN